MTEVSGAGAGPAGTRSGPTASSSGPDEAPPGGAPTAPAPDRPSETEVPTGSPPPGPAAMKVAASASDSSRCWGPAFIDNDARAVPTANETITVKEGIL